MQLWPVLANLIREERGIPLRINGMPDHVHIFARLWQGKAVADVVRAVKAKSSGWLHKQYGELREFSWQTGYGAFTVSRSQGDIVSDYVANQEKHHAKRDYLSEIRKLFEAHEIDHTEQDLEEV